MNTVIDKDDIDDTAAQWVLRMDRGGLDASERSELAAWLDADSRHQGAFIRAQAIWCDVDRVAALGGTTLSAPASRWSGAWLGRAAAMAACVIALTLAGLGVSNRYLAGRETTDRGETRRMMLADGSALALNTQSVVQVKFDGDERRIVMRRGEASFQVAHDEQRPFVVQAGDVSVRAVGTAFNVRMRPEGVEVTVTEGVVEILRADGNDATSPAPRVRHNEEVIAQPEQPIEVAPLSETEIARRLAWQEGRLIFEGERLDVAAAEVNRYSALPVVIDDPALAEKSFVGVFKIGDARGFVNAAAAAFDAQVREQDQTLHLAR
jgi:transmembrane sensor